MDVEDLARLSPDLPATLLWCGERNFADGGFDARRDFARLAEALAFIVSELPLGPRLTAWLISGDRLIPPDRVSELWMRMAA